MVIEKLTVNSVEVMEEKPWEYILYKVNNKLYYLAIAYSPKSFVDSIMYIKLNENEVELMLKDSTWLSKFSEKIRYSPKEYLDRSESMGRGSLHDYLSKKQD